MNEARTFTTSAAERYDRALQRSLKLHPLPPEVVAPQPSRCWPVENVALLEKYRDWLLGIGAADAVINQHRIPMAGHVLGLNCKPHPQLHLVDDLEKAMDFVVARKQGEMWQRNCRHSLDWLRRFMKEERGLVIIDTVALADVSHYQVGLPTWLITQLTKLLHIRQANWRPSRLQETTLRFWGSHTAVFRWLFTTYTITAVTEIQRKQLYAFLDARLAEGAATSTVNVELRSFQAVLRFLQEQEIAVPLVLLRLRGLKQANRLPRFLTDEQVGKLRDAFAQAVEEADSAVSYRNACLNRATFYLMWQGGLRLGEVEELTLADLNLEQQQLAVRQGKGLKDRMVYLTDVAVTALQAYLAVRGDSLLDHLLLYRHHPLNKDFVRGRLQAVGKAVGVAVTPHQLRHTYATQLLNAGCSITTIQALLGHQRLNTTMVYARVHDETVAEDYFAAMEKVEKRLTPHLNPTPEPQPTTEPPPMTPEQLVTLVDALRQGTLNTNQQTLLHELRTGLLTLAEQWAKDGGDA